MCEYAAVDDKDSVGGSEERGALAEADSEEAIELDDGGRSGRGRVDSAESGIATLFLGPLRTGHNAQTTPNRAMRARDKDDQPGRRGLRRTDTRELVVIVRAPRHCHRHRRAYPSPLIKPYPHPHPLCPFLFVTRQTFLARVHSSYRYL